MNTLMFQTHFSRRPALIAACLLVPFIGLAAEPNWPHWRGPLDNGVAPEANPPSAWGETENVKWKVKIPGSGTATPIIWNNQVFIQTAIRSPKKPEAALPLHLSSFAAAVGTQDAPAPRQRRLGGPG